jgi:hypothetical protein
MGMLRAWSCGLGADELGAATEMGEPQTRCCLSSNKTL